MVMVTGNCTGDKIASQESLQSLANQDSKSLKQEPSSSPCCSEEEFGLHLEEEPGPLAA